VSIAGTKTLAISKDNSVTSLIKFSLIKNNYYFGCGMAPGRLGPCISKLCSVCAPECLSNPAVYFSYCAISSVNYSYDFIYLYGLKVGLLTAAWSMKASPSFVPAGMIYSKDSHFVYLFSQDSSNLFLSIIDNWTGSLLASEI
jgi:hypothetical protein